MEQPSENGLTPEMIDFLSDDKDEQRRTKEFLSWPAWKQYATLPVGIIGMWLEVLSAQNTFTVTIVFLGITPFLVFRKWLDMRKGTISRNVHSYFG